MLRILLLAVIIFTTAFAITITIGEYFPSKPDIWYRSELIEVTCNGGYKGRVFFIQRVGATISPYIYEDESGRSVTLPYAECVKVTLEVYPEPEVGG